jgi:hypothetical protein
MDTVARTLVVLVALFLTGAPFARDRSAVARFLFEACALGLILQLAIGFVLMRSGHFYRLDLALATLVVIGIGLALGGWRLFVNPPALGGWWAVLTFGIGALAIVLRTHPSYFIFETGDMGEYVNFGNQVARGAPLIQSFPHGFTMFLASSNMLLGRAHTVGGLPALGVTLVFGVIAFAHALSLRVWAAFAGALLVAVHPSAVWFSTFPVSESLYAVLLTAGAYFLLRARIDRSHWYAAVAGITLGLLLMVRGNGMLLVPIVVVLWGASALTDDDDTFRVQRTLTGVALASISLAYLYDVRYLDKYFVNKQLHEFLPSGAFRVANHVHWLSWSWSLLAAIIVLLAGTIFVGNLLRRWAQRVDVFRWCTVAAVAVALIAILVVGGRGLGDALLRWGPLVLLLSLGGLVMVLVRPARYLDAGTTLFVVLGIVTYSVLFASRHHTPKGAPYYLYWDRYLFSEVFPLAIVLALIGLRALTEWLVALQPRRTLAIAIAAILGAVLLVPDLVETRKATRATLFGDAYGALAKIDKMTRTPNGQKPAIVYSGLETMPPNWTAFDTSRAFALPLFQTFKRNVIGVTFKPPALDAVYDPIGARNVLALHHLSSGYLVAARAPNTERFPDDAHTSYVGTIDYTAPLIARAVDRSQEKFRDVPFQFDVYAIKR